MAVSEDLEAIVSANLHERDGTGAIISKSVAVIWDSSSTRVEDCTLLRLLDRMGHVVVAPQHPDRPVNPEHNYSPRVHFYKSTNPYSEIDAGYWSDILLHAAKYTNQPTLSHLIIAGNESVLKDSNIRNIMQGLRSHLLVVQGATIQVYRNHVDEPYNKTVGRYRRIINLVTPELLTRSINGVPASSNSVSKQGLISGALERVQLAARIQDILPAITANAAVNDMRGALEDVALAMGLQKNLAANLLDATARDMIHRWSSRRAFIQQEPLFITIRSVAFDVDQGVDNMSIDEMLA